MEKKKFQFPDGTIVECDVDDKNEAIHEINKHAPCACGKGILTRKLEFYLKNGMPGIRYPSHEIECEECNKKYNLTRLTLSEPTDELRTEPDGYVVHVPNFKFIDVLRPKDASGDVFTEEEFKKLYIINWEED